MNKLILSAVLGTLFSLGFLYGSITANGADAQGWYGFASFVLAMTTLVGVTNGKIPLE